MRLREGFFAVLAFAAPAAGESVATAKAAVQAIPSAPVAPLSPAVAAPLASLSTLAPLPSFPAGAPTAAPGLATLPPAAAGLAPAARAPDSLQAAEQVAATGKAIVDRYVDPVDPESLYRAGLPGTIKGSDRSASEPAVAQLYRQLRSLLNQPGQDLLGSGTAVHHQTARPLTVTAVDPGSALAAHARPGDRIVSIDGVPTASLDRRESEALLARLDSRGGSLKISRAVPGAGAPQTLSARILGGRGLAEFFLGAAETLGAAPARLVAAARAMTARLDPFSRFFDPGAARARRESRAQYSRRLGMDVEVLPGGAGVGVLWTEAHSPARTAGLRRGDVITEINGDAVDRTTPLEKVYRLLSPVEGLPIVVKVSRPGEAASLSFRMRKAEIRVKKAFARRLSSERVYLYLSEFSPESVEEVKTALWKNFDAGAHELILDLRFNGGGSTQPLLAMAELFLPPGSRIFSERARNGEETAFFVPKDGGAFSDVKLTVLVNGRSASAAEVFAAALQDHGRARVIGERTYGKGVGQSNIELPGDAYLKLTTKRWRSPKGRDIDGVGLAPDLAVPVGAEQARELKRSLAVRLHEDGEGPEAEDPVLAAALGR